MYDVRSCTDSNKHYTVTIISAVCGDKPGCIPQCNSTQCQYLCRHMISCTCWDYSEGYLCKHSHKVWSTYYGSDDHHQVSCDQLEPSFKQDDFGYYPEEQKELKAGECIAISHVFNDDCLCTHVSHLIIAVEGKIRAIDKEVENIRTSVSRVEAHHILDHALVTLTQLSRSLNTHLAEKEEVSSEFPIS